MRFFEYNSTNKDSWKYLYEEFSEHYEYLQKKKR